MIRAAIYSRKSKFSEKGESIQNQIDLCMDYAKKNFEIDHFIFYEDEGYSGGNTYRPKYLEMIEDISKKKFDLLICYRLDRISRNISDFADLINLLHDNNIDFISIREQFDTSTPMGRAMMYITSVFAQLERETIAERIRDNMHQLARTGRWLGGRTPLGFESKQIYYYDEHQNKKKAYQLIPIPEELIRVEKIFKKYLELGSLSQLEIWTSSEGLKTKSNKNFDKSILKFILSNPVYVKSDEKIYQYFLDHHSDIASSKNEFNGKQGLMVFNKYDERKKNQIIRRDESDWIIAIAKHEGIIESSDWIEVQKKIKYNRKKTPRKGTGKYGLISHFLTCGICGSKMRISVYHRKSGTYYYYKCLLKERSKGKLCNVTNLNGKNADQAVLKEIQKLTYEKKILYHQIKKEYHALKKSFSSPKSQKIQLKKQLKEYHTYIDNLTMELAKCQNQTAGKYILKKIQELDKKILDLQEQINRISKDDIPIQNSNIFIESILQLIENFSQVMNILYFDEKKKILEKLVEKITWDGEKLKIEFLK